MTIHEAITRADILMPNQYTDAEKIRWLCCSIILHMDTAKEGFLFMALSPVQKSELPIDDI